MAARPTPEPHPDPLGRTILRMTASASALIGVDIAASGLLREGHLDAASGQSVLPPSWWKECVVGTRGDHPRNRPQGELSSAGALGRECRATRVIHSTGSGRGWSAGAGHCPRGRPDEPGSGSGEQSWGQAAPAWNLGEGDGGHEAGLAPTPRSGKQIREVVPGCSDRKVRRVNARIRVARRVECEESRGMKHHEQSTETSTPEEAE